MTRRALLAAVALWATAYLTTNGQEPDKGPIVGLVDVQQIYRDHKPFVERIKEFSTEGEAAQKKIEGKNIAFGELVQKLKATEQGSKEFNDLQRKAQKLQSEIQESVNNERKQLATKELALNVEFHKAIRAAIDKVAREKGIKIVFNRTKHALESEKPEESLAAINQPVLFEDGLDITADVQKALEAEAAASAPNEGKSKKTEEKKSEEGKPDQKKKSKEIILDIESK